MLPLVWLFRAEIAIWHAQWQWSILRADLMFAWSIPFDVSRLTRRAAVRGSLLESRTTGSRIHGTECIIYGCINRKKRARQKLRFYSQYLADAAVNTTLPQFASWCVQIRIDFRALDATGNPASSSNCQQRMHSAEKLMQSVLLMRFCLRNRQAGRAI